MRTFIVMSLCVLAAVFLAGRVIAESVEFEFGGTITMVMSGFDDCEPPWNDVAVNDQWSIVYSFESTTPDTNPASDHGSYAAITSYKLDIGGNVVSDSGLAGEWISLFSDRPVGVDQYEVWIYMPDGYQWFMQLDDMAGTVWDTDALPLCGDIKLSDFSGVKDFTLEGPFGGFEDCIIFGSVDYHKCSSEECEILVYKDDIKWSQPPVEVDEGIINGWDEYSSYFDSPIVADDWVCTDDRPITDIHWWGSFKGWDQCVPPSDAPSAFHIGIWTDVPNPDPNNPNSFSHPDKLVWEKITNCYVWSCAGSDRDPRGIDEDDTCFKFDQLLSQDEWFHQDPTGGTQSFAGNVYWLSVAAIYDGQTPQHPWGWKTRPHFCNDDAVRILRPVSVCPDDCENPDNSEFAGGVADGFAQSNSEPAAPSPQLSALFSNWADFDEPFSDHHFGHTITGLPPCIVRAELEISLKGLGTLACNDTFNLQLTGGTPIVAWRRRIGTGGSSSSCDGSDGLLATTWGTNSQNIFTLDLSALPNADGSTTDLLPLLNSDGRLDVLIHDDTAVDYMILRVWSCAPVPGEWPPQVGSFWQNGEPIEYPAGVSWDMAFVLTSNRKYEPKNWRWANDEMIGADLYPDGKIDMKDYAIFASYWLKQAQLCPLCP